MQNQGGIFIFRSKQIGQVHGTVVFHRHMFELERSLREFQEGLIGHARIHTDRGPGRRWGEAGTSARAAGRGIGRVNVLFVVVVVVFEIHVHISTMFHVITPVAARRGRRTVQGGNPERRTHAYHCDGQGVPTGIEAGPQPDGNVRIGLVLGVCLLELLVCPLDRVREGPTNVGNNNVGAIKIPPARFRL